MLDTIYTTTAGLQSFSKGLNAISGNVSNVNTPGYKGTELLYQDVHYRYTVEGERNGTLYGAQLGGGVTADLTSTRFSQGDFRDTGNDLDVAINGKGFFVIEKDSGYVYSRAGQFEFNKDGDLVTRIGKYRVMSIDDHGALHSISKNALRTQPAIPTTNITFLGNLSVGGTTHTINSVGIIDAQGAPITLSLTFTNNSTTTPLSWLVSVRDAAGNAVGTEGELRFQGNGSPAEGFNTYTLDYQPSDSASAQQIVFNFGEVGTFTGATSFSSGSTSDLALGKVDGRVQGSLLSISFDDHGRLQAKYSNDQSVSGDQLALADFADLQGLLHLGGGLYERQALQKVILNRPGESAFGLIVPKKIELSNVELSQQFTDMIVVQRGYQAASQVLTVANEMMQQLLEGMKK